MMGNNSMPVFKRGQSIDLMLEYDLTDERIVQSFEGVTVSAAMRLQKTTQALAWFDCTVDAARNRVHYRISGKDTERLPVGYYIMDTRFQTASGEVDFSDDVLIRLVRETTYAQ